MSLRLFAELALGLILLLATYPLTLFVWQRQGLTGSELRQRQRRVRKFSAVLVFVLLAVALVYWRLWAAGIVGTGPGISGISLIPLAALVCLIGVVSVRGLWFLTEFHWLNSVSYRVSLQAGIVGIVSAVTAFDLKDVPGRNFGYFLALAFLTAILALGSFFLERLLPDEDAASRGGLAESQSSENSNSMQLATLRATGDDSVFVTFAMPEAARIYCGQYLLYFGEFLKDVGVDVETKIADEAGSLLFWVTPTDKTENLNNIWEALEVYVRLAFVRFDDTTNESIAVQRLEATILRLQADLKLKAAELQAKNATIQYQQLIINVQNGFLTGEIQKESLKETLKPEDPEDLIPGVVALGTLETKGVKVNLGEILRKLKSLFARKV